VAEDDGGVRSPELGRRQAGVLESGGGHVEGPQVGAVAGSGDARGETEGNGVEGGVFDPPADP
jgi:hypothetical protein